MKLLRASLLLAFLCLSMQSSATETFQAPWVLSYSDGSANKYSFRQDGADAEVKFEYIPVKPEESSTGFYSGGDPRSGTLSAKEASRLKKKLAKLEADPKLRAPDRNKGTGAFTIKSGDLTRSFIIEMGPALSDFDSFLKKL